MQSPTADSAQAIEHTEDRGEHVTHRGRTYRVLHSTHETKDDSPYILVPLSGRGAAYFLTRNVPDPTALFGVRFDGAGKILPGWFTDKDGRLRSCG